MSEEFIPDNLEIIAVAQKDWHKSMLKNISPKGTRVFRTAHKCYICNEKVMLSKGMLDLISKVKKSNKVFRILCTNDYTKRDIDKNVKNVFISKKLALN